MDPRTPDDKPPLVLVPLNGAAHDGHRDEDDLMRRAREVLERRPGVIQVWLRRDELELPVPLRLKNVEQLTELSSLIYPEHGGGEFEYRVRIGGALVHGSWEPIRIAGEPRRFGSRAPADEPPVTTPPAPPALDVEAIRAQCRREDQERADREAREAERLAKAVTSAFAPYGRALEALAERPAAPPAPKLEDELERFAKLKNLFAPPPAHEPSESERRALKRAEDAEERSRKQEADAQIARDEARDKQLRGLRRLLKRKPRQNPTLELAAKAKEANALHELVSALKEKADSTGSTILQSFIGPLQESAAELAADLGKIVKVEATKTVRRAQARIKADAAAAAKSPEIPATWLAWVEAVFDDGKLVVNELFVRGSLERYPVEIAGVSRITTKAGLVEFARANLGAVTADAIAELDESETGKFLAVVGALRATVTKVKASPAPATDEAEQEDAGEDLAGEGEAT